MGKPVGRYKVESLTKVNTSLYIEGDLFITNKSVGILVGNKIETIFTGRPNFRPYVKKEEVEKMFEDFYKQKEEVKK